MAANARSRRESAPAAPTVTLPAGDDASGMATMLAGLLRDNMRDFPVRARVAARTRGDVVLTATDRNVSVTLSFRRGEVLVHDGAASGAPVLAGPWMEMTKLCSGQASPLTALARRQLSLVRGRRMVAVPAASFVLTVPSSFYGDRGPLFRRAAMVSAAAGVAVFVVVRRGRALPGRWRRGRAWCRRGSR